MVASEGYTEHDRAADEMSKRLREGSLKAVFHGAPERLTLKELVRCYHNLVGDATRVMLRIKAIYRARAIPTPGVSVYRASQRKKWLAKLDGGARIRAGSLLSQLDVLLELRPKAKAAMVAAARRQPGWRILRTIPFLRPVRVARSSRARRSPANGLVSRRSMTASGPSTTARCCWPGSTNGR